jgi:NitT/TauT family transport system substrate-binding protein
MLRRALLTAFLLAAAPTLAQPVETPRLRFSLDWAWQGPQAVFAIAETAGLFTQAGLAVQMDRGAGSADTIARVAGGAYQVGFGDINALIQYNADSANRGREITAFYMVFDSSPLAVMTLRRSGITTAQQLMGRKVGAPLTDGGRQMFPAFARASGIDLARIEWVTMNPQLREPMLVRGDVDAITGFITSGVLSLRGLGVAEQDIVVLRYRDAGLPNYGSAIYARADFLRANPRTVTAFTAALNRGIKAAIADPQAAITALRTRDPLVDDRLELARLMVAHRELTLTPHVLANGLSSVVPDRMRAAIDVVVQTYQLPTTPALEVIYTDAFLPPAAERMPPALPAVGG